MRKLFADHVALSSFAITIVLAGFLAGFLFLYLSTGPAPGCQVSCREVVEDDTARAPFDYLLYLPKEYGKLQHKWPLLLSLHGCEQRGNNLDLVEQEGIPKLIDEGNSFPFVVVSPQCKKERSWEPEKLFAFLEHIQAKYAIDPDRICVTGFELGGYGTWNMAAVHPERLAAIVPIEGFPEKQYNQSHVRIKGLSIWAYHGTNDLSTPFRSTNEFFRDLWAIGGKGIRSVSTEEDHDLWMKPYKTQALLNWLVRQRRKSALKTHWKENPPSPGIQTAGLFVKNIGAAEQGDQFEIDYWLYLPKEYEKKSAWPLVLFLHGKEQQGEDVDLVKNTGIPQFLESGQHLPFIVVSPQCRDRVWNSRELLALIDHIQSEYDINPNQVCVMGEGIGADGAWELAIEEPDLFAAIVAVGNIPETSFLDHMHDLKNTAIWVLQPDDKKTNARFSYLQKVFDFVPGSVHPKLTVYSKAEYDPYKDPQLHAFLAGRRRQPPYPPILESLDIERIRSFPPPKEFMDLFTRLEYRYTGGQYDQETIQYRLFEPKPAEPHKKYPLIVWLHGHGFELNFDGGQLSFSNLILDNPAARDRYPFFLLAMHSPGNRGWYGSSDQGKSGKSDEPLEILMEILQHTMSRYPIDRDRVSLVGICSGGSAGWELAARYPNVFSALAPCSPTFNKPLYADRYANMSVWAFNSTFDFGSPIAGTRNMVTALRNHGCDVRLTEIPQHNHYCWHEAFQKHDLLEWLLHTKRKR